MTKRKPKPDTVGSLTAELAQLRYEDKLAAWSLEPRDPGPEPMLEDFMAEALAFVLRCRKADLR